MPSPSLDALLLYVRRRKPANLKKMARSHESVRAPGVLGEGRQGLVEMGEPAKGWRSKPRSRVELRPRGRGDPKCTSPEQFKVTRKKFSPPWRKVTSSQVSVVFSTQAHHSVRTE